MNEAKILNAISEAVKTLDQKFETRFGSLENKFTSLDGKFGSLEGKFGSLEKQFQDQRADIINIKEKTLETEKQIQFVHADIIEIKGKIEAAFDSSSRLPEISDKVEKHGNKIEVLEQKSIGFDTAIRNLSK